MKSSPKMVKTGFSASSIAKAQLGEQAEERRKQQKAVENKALEQSAFSANEDSEASSSSGSYKSSSKKHVTFEQNDHLLSDDDKGTGVNEINNNNVNNGVPDSLIDNSNLKVYKNL